MRAPTWPARRLGCWPTVAGGHTSHGESLIGSDVTGMSRMPHRLRRRGAGPLQRWPARKARTIEANAVTDVLDSPSSRELLERDITRLAYVAQDGTPRVVPIGFSWNGTNVVMCTTANAPKVPALRRNPTVALTIDTEVHPPTILLIR